MAEKRVMVTGIVLAVIGATPLAFFGWSRVQREREAKAAAAAELAAADAARAAEIRSESAAQREVENQRRAGRQDARLDVTLKQLESGGPTMQCDAALLIGRMGARQHAARLADLMSSASSSSVRGCAASALVDLGERDTAMAAYLEWARGSDPDLRLAAFEGFGHIGPSVATVALPILGEALKSPNMNVRVVTVEALGRLGAAAVPLLDTASHDADKVVRDVAAAALQATGRRP